MQNPDDTIYFDDAGTGNIYGGLVIGALCNGRYHSRILAPEWFGLGDAFSSLISSTILEMALSYGPSSRTAALCRCSLFNAAARDLGRLGWTVRRTVIDGELQDRAEEDFLSHLIALGLPDHIRRLRPDCEEKKPECYRSLNEFCTAFILACPERRLGAAKPTCGTLKKIVPSEIMRHHHEKIRGRCRRCVECGEVVTRDAYRCSGAGRVFYVHARCAKWV